MLPIRRVVLIFMLMHCLGSTITTSQKQQQQQLAKREVPQGYKYLVFPQGSNVQLVYCMTVASLGKPQGLFTFGVTAGLAYELPYHATVPHRRPAEVYHRRSRRELYGRIESLLRTRGHPEPRGCLLRALCEAGRAARYDNNNNSDDNRAAGSSSGKRSFQREILHSIFTYPEWSGEDVDEDDDDEKQPSQHQQQNRLKALEYDKAYNAQDDCDKLFAVSGSDSDSCPLLRLLI